MLKVKGGIDLLYLFSTRFPTCFQRFPQGLLLRLFLFICILCRVVWIWSACGRGVCRMFPYGICMLRFGRCLLDPGVIFLLKLHDDILITFPKLFCFPGQHVIHLKHHIIIFAHVLIMFSLFQKHTQIIVIATMHLVFEHLIKFLIHVIVLEQRPYLLIALVSLIPLSDMRNLTPSEVLIFGLGVMLFSGSKSVSHGHSFHQFLHHLKHQVNFFVQRPICRWMCIPLGFLITFVESLFDLPRHHHVYLGFD
jgi:hypothetical protein